jgi:hypothetical protein
MACDDRRSMRQRSLSDASRHRPPEVMPPDARRRALGRAGCAGGFRGAAAHKDGDGGGWRGSGMLAGPRAHVARPGGRWETREGGGKREREMKLA